MTAEEQARDYLAKSRSVTLYDDHPDVIIAALLKALEDGREREERLERALRKARGQFYFYADVHSNKGTPDGDAKAATNLEFANMCSAALQEPTP